MHVFRRYELPRAAEQVRPYDSSGAVCFSEFFHRWVFEPYAYCPAHHFVVLRLQHPHPCNELVDIGELRVCQLL